MPKVFMAHSVCVSRQSSIVTPISDILLHYLHIMVVNYMLDGPVLE